MKKARAQKPTAQNSKTRTKAKAKTASHKNAVIKKAKAFLGTKTKKSVAAKKSQSKTAQPKMKKTTEANGGDSLYIHHHEDPAHSSGHRHMNLQDESPRSGRAQAKSRSATNKLNRAEKIQRTSATNRRIITGAAVGKTGQITIK